MDPQPEESFSARPEARFALATGLLGAAAATVLTVTETLEAPGPASAVAYVYLPFVAICAAAIAGVWGVALGCVCCSLAGVRSYYRAVLMLAWLLVLAFPAVFFWVRLTAAT